MAPSVFRYHEISEAGHRVLNPFTEAKLALVGELCRLRSGDRLLDLACGKAELLATWAHRYGITGTGVDLSEPDTVRAVAVELDMLVARLERELAIDAA